MAELAKKVQEGDATMLPGFCQPGQKIPYQKCREQVPAFVTLSLELINPI